MQNIRNYLILVADIRSIVGRKYWLYLFLVVLTGFFEGISLASVIPLLAGIGIGTLEGVSQGSIGNLASVALSYFDIQPTIGAFTILVLVALSISTFFYLTQAYIGSQLQTLYVYRWQKKLIESIFSANWQFFQTQRHGEVVNSIVSESQRLGSAFYHAGLLITGIIHGVIYLAIAMYLSVATASVIILIGGALFLLTRPIVQRSILIGNGITSETMDLQVATGELVSGAKSLLASATEDKAIFTLDNMVNKLRLHFFSNAYYVQLAKGIFDFGCAALVASILYFSHEIFGIDPSSALVILAIFVRLMPKVTGLQQGMWSLNVSFPALISMKKVFNLSINSAEIKTIGSLPANLQCTPIEVFMKNVCVKHGNRIILDFSDLCIRAGECVALVGHSGSGKSTLVDVMLGLAPASAAQEILVNGHPLDKIPITAFRKRVGYMGQETILFDTSIRENVAWGQMDVSDELVYDAIKRASAFEFIEKLPLGIETQITNRGTTLSGGERQRIGLARALLGSPGLLVLDEATSALDFHIENSVISSLEKLKGTATIIMIAHRLSSVKIADRIIVLDNGRIIASGTWDELYAQKDGAFRLLCNLQS